MNDEMKAHSLAQFEQMGEDHVRLWRNTSNSTGISRTYATEWLAEIDQQSRLRSESSQAEHLETAISAKDAAWAAAEAAREAAREAHKANIIATLAMIGAVVAIAVSIVGLFLR